MIVIWAQDRAEPLFCRGNRNMLKFHPSHLVVLDPPESWQWTKRERFFRIQLSDFNSWISAERIFFILPSPKSQSEVPASRLQFLNTSPSKSHSPVPDSCFLQVAACISTWLIGFNQSMIFCRSFSVMNHQPERPQTSQLRTLDPVQMSTLVSSTIPETDVIFTSNSFMPRCIFPEASLRALRYYKSERRFELTD